MRGEAKLHSRLPCLPCEGLMSKSQGSHGANQVGIPENYLPSRQMQYAVHPTVAPKLGGRKTWTYTKGFYCRRHLESRQSGLRLPRSDLKALEHIHDSRSPLAHRMGSCHVKNILLDVQCNQLPLKKTVRDGKSCSAAALHDISITGLLTI